jgi:hypothetical protein
MVSHMPLARAVATLPFKDPKLAAAALRGRVQLIVDRYGGEPDWTTLHIEGPKAYRDARGTEWFEWVATVRVHQLTDRALADDPPATGPTVADLGILRRRPAS